MSEKEEPRAARSLSRPRSSAIKVKLMKAMGIPEDRICKTITNPRTRKPVGPDDAWRGPSRPSSRAALPRFHAMVGNFIIWRDPRQKSRHSAMRSKANRSA